MPNPEIAPALVERMVALVQNLAGNKGVYYLAKPCAALTYGVPNTIIAECLAEARAIVAELPAPVDPDGELADAVLREMPAIFSDVSLLAYRKEDYRAGALAAIKRIRQEQTNA